MSKALLLEELDFVSNTVMRLLEKVEPSHLDVTPPHMRSLRELMNHLVQIPAVDLLILKEASEDEVRQLEAKIQSDSIMELSQTYRKSIEELKRHYDQMNEEDYFNKVSTAFYGAAHTQEKWLLDIVTHTYHHRAQLFTYLKMSGVDINMFILY